MVFLRFLFGTIALSVVMIASFSDAACFVDQVDFEREVAPILKQHCIRCHSDEKAEGGVNLSTRSHMLGDGESLQVLEAGSLAKSLLLDVVQGEKPQMPKSGSPLSENQLATLQRWIEQGAPWPEPIVLAYDPNDWWSLRSLRLPPVPALDVADSNIRNPIDAFVEAERQRRGLIGSPEADRRTLIRRVTYDLIGLPPSPEETLAFEHDTDPRAYARLVDRLLDSPRYGERWARHWLDVVHYGDTHGYDKDKLRPNAWPYRDYVIRSLNQDKPYTKFVQEQLAGDVIAPDARDGIEALGFIACGPFDFVGQIEVAEGTIEKQRVRNVDRDDMVSVAINTFVSMTAQCARCHDHKFDPISQRDYYQLQSIFAAVDRADREYDSDPETARVRRDLSSALLELQKRREELEREFRELCGERLQRLDEAIEAYSKAVSTARPPEYGYHSAISPNPETSKWVQLDLGQERSVRRIGIAGASDDFAGIGAGFGFPVRFRIEVSNDAQFAKNVTTIASYQDADYPNPGTALTWFEASDQPFRYVRVTASRLAHRSSDYIFAIAELLIENDAGENIGRGSQVTSLDSIEAPPRWGMSNLVDGIFPSMHEQTTVNQLQSLRSQRDILLQEVAGSERVQRMQDLDLEIASIRMSLQQLPPKSKVYAAATDFTGSGSFQPSLGRPRTIRVLNRGSETQPGDEVNPAALRCIDGLTSEFAIGHDAAESQRRLALAQWITDKRNHLTWRSIVNRVWHYHFGRGLVESVNDFGRMGAEPTHPELLDWLAATFRDSDQSLKELHRMIVMSATYRQRSDHMEANAQIDAGNQYLWRMNRRKLEAEAIRDSVLLAADKLQLEPMGGPGFHVFGLIDDHSPHYLYEEFNPDDPASHRRSVYRFIVRSVPDPWMTTLDCADASIITDRRNETLTALQALSLLNHRFMIRMSEHFARRVESSNPDLKSQIERAFLIALQRKPTEQETQTLYVLGQRHGLENVCRTLLNANEFLFVD